MILDHLNEARAAGRKLLAVLIDPDGAEEATLRELAEHANAGRVDLFLWGGSLVNSSRADDYLERLKSLLIAPVPVVLFPGSVYQLNGSADALLFLSLISGRNPELLIGQHVAVAGRVRELGLEVIPTGYLLVDGGRPTSVSYVSGTNPLPADKPPLAAATALAGALLGLRLLYLDAGSGARWPVSAAMIAAVRREVDLPLIVGGGIRSAERAVRSLRAGADVVVVGNGLERDRGWLPELAAAVHGVKEAVG